VQVELIDQLNQRDFELRGGELGPQGGLARPISRHLAPPGNGSGANNRFAGSLLRAWNAACGPARHDQE